MADFSKEIAHLEALVNGATQAVVVDGTNTTFDLAAARKRLAELRLLDDDSQAAGRTRPRVSGLNLGGCW
jgi:hypothetical protein